MGNAVKEVRRAVERIDDPAVRLVAAFEDPAFLHQEAVTRPGLRKLLEKNLLRLLVGGGNEVRRPLERDLQVFDFAEVALQAARRLAGGSDHYAHRGGMAGHIGTVQSARRR